MRCEESALTAEQGKVLGEAVFGTSEQQTIYENASLTIQATKRVNISSVKSNFVVGKTYIYTAKDGGSLALFVNNTDGASGATYIANPTYNQTADVEVEFEWTQAMANATYLELYSRRSTEQTWKVKIELKPVIVEGLTAKMDNAEDDIDTLEADVETLQHYSPKAQTIILLGASFADFDKGFTGDDGARPGNNWFEKACIPLNVTGINNARSGTHILDVARALNGNADGNGHLPELPWTTQEFEDMDVLAIMFTHNYDVADTTHLKDTYDGTEDFLNLPLKATSYVGYICDQINQLYYYAQAFDYVLKKYAELCYACRLDSNSKWYGTSFGKPVKVVLCTHWHDARATYNTAIRTLAERWGTHICEFDKLIGFSKNQVFPPTSAQQSILYAIDTETISGVSYGWHPIRAIDSAIQERMAEIFTKENKW